MALVKARKSFRYAGRRYQRGEMVQVKDPHVFVLQAAKAIMPQPPLEPVKTDKEVVGLSMMTKPQLLEIATVAGLAVNSRATKSDILHMLRYRRRDMMAEGK